MRRVLAVVLVLLALGGAAPAVAAQSCVYDATASYWSDAAEYWCPDSTGTYWVRWSVPRPTGRVPARERAQFGQWLRETSATPLYRADDAETALRGLYGPIGR